MIQDQEELIQRLLDGQATEDDATRFRSLFMEDAYFRQLYYGHTALSVFLEDKVNPRTVAATRKSGEDLHRRRPRLDKRIWMGMVALLVLSLVGVFFLQVREKARSHGQISLAAGTSWSLRKAGGAEVSGSAAEVIFEPGSSLQLEQGVAVIHFGSGMRMTVSGASRLVDLGHGEFHLDHGKAWLDIPEGAGGITLVTARTKVTIQDARLGVISNFQGGDQIHVLSGRVIGQGLGGFKQQVTVEPQTAVAIDNLGYISEHQPGINGFAKSLPSSLPFIHWSFDLPEDGRFATEGKHELLGDIRAEYRSPSATPTDERSAAGVFGKAVRFAHSGDLVITSYPGVDGIQPRTIAFWMRLPKEPVSNYGGNYKRGNWTGVLGWGRRHFPKPSLNESFHAIVGSPKISRPGGSGGELIVPILSFEGIWFEGKTDVGDGDWHHLVWTFSGKLGPDYSPEVVCYCDGKSEPLLVGGLSQDRLKYWPPIINTVVDSQESVPLMIGASLLNIADHNSIFPGEMDEVYVIEGKITADEVRLLYQINQFRPALPARTSAVEAGN